MNAHAFQRPAAWPLPAPLRVGAVFAGATAAAMAVAVLTYSYGPQLIGAAVLVAAVFTTMLIWPSVAVVFTVTLLYLNIPAILVREHGVPAVVAGSFILLLALPMLRSIVFRREPFRADRSLWLMIAFLGVLLVSTLFAKDSARALVRISEYCLHGILLYWLLINTIRTLPELKRVMWSLLLAAALVSVLSLYQAVTKAYHQEFGGLASRDYTAIADADEEGRRGREGYTGSARAHGPIDEPNRFAQMLVVLLPISLATARLTRRSVLKIGAAALGMAILTGSLLTYSRGAFLSVLVAAAIAVAWRWIQLRYLLLCTLAAVLLIPIVAPRFFDRIHTLGATTSLVATEPDAQVTADGSIRGRATEMMAALHVFIDHPIIGVGPGQFAPYYSMQYFGAGGMKFRDIQSTRRAHSLYIEMAAETGVIGLITFLAIVGTLLQRLWRERARLTQARSPHVDLATAMLLAIIIYMVTAVFLHLAYQRYFWLVMALASATVHVLQTDEPARHAA